MSAKTVEETYERLKPKLRDLVPEDELRHKAALVYEINRLKEERGAVILGHNYMEPEIFLSVADFTGDSFELCRRAAETDRDPIVFCGVRFMAETAKIINPNRTVLLPSLEAGCSLAESITAADVRELRRRYPGVPVVTYINTYAEVKAECDVVCTSGNAARVVESLNADTVIFLPDEYLARNVARETGRHIIVAVRGGRSRDTVVGTGRGGEGRASAGGNKGAASEKSTEIERVIIGWPGRCEVHEKFTAEDVHAARRRFAGVAVLAHPECSPEVIEAVDFAGGTKAMIEHVQKMQAPSYLLMTEASMGENVGAQNPGKEILRFRGEICPHMKRITLEQTLAALRENRHVVEVPEEIRARARRSVDRMLALG